MTPVLEVWVLVELPTTGERGLKLLFGFGAAQCGQLDKVKLVVAC